MILLDAVVEVGIAAVDDVTRFPALGPGQGSIGHERSEDGDPLAMKGGLDQAALLQPRLGTPRL